MGKVANYVGKRAVNSKAMSDLVQRYPTAATLVRHAIQTKQVEFYLAAALKGVRQGLAHPSGYTALPVIDVVAHDIPSPAPQPAALPAPQPATDWELLS